MARLKQSPQVAAKQAEIARLNKEELRKEINVVVSENRGAWSIDRTNDNFSDLIFKPSDAPPVPLGFSPDPKDRAIINFADNEQFRLALGIIKERRMDRLQTYASIGSEVVVTVDRETFKGIKKLTK